MKISQAVTRWEAYQKGNLKPNTLRAYHRILTKFTNEFAERDCHDLTTDEVLSFLNTLTEHTKQQTKRTRYAHLSSLPELSLMYYKKVNLNGDILTFGFMKRINM
jgi:site-specific recombinase XerD